MHGPVEHLIAQPPQLLPSVAGSTQVPLHTMSGAAQLQTPPRHTPAPQLMPQSPQFAASLLVSTHTPPHALVPDAQTHFPAPQIMPALQVKIGRAHV